MILTHDIIFQIIVDPIYREDKIHCPFVYEVQHYATLMSRKNATDIGTDYG